jgi:hypothetical protein
MPRLASVSAWTRLGAGHPPSRAPYRGKHPIDPPGSGSNTERPKRRSSRWHCHRRDEQARRRRVWHTIGTHPVAALVPSDNQDDAAAGVDRGNQPANSPPTRSRCPRGRIRQFACAERISSRRYPYVHRSCAGRAARVEATTAKPRASTSETRCPASARRASDPATRPATISWPPSGPTSSHRKTAHSQTGRPPQKEFPGHRSTLGLAGPQKGLQSLTGQLPLPTPHTLKWLEQAG